MTSGNEETLTRDDFLARARKLAPVWRERAAQAEQSRRAPEATIDDILSNQLNRICQPARYGGHELTWDALCEMNEILGAGCGSQGWVAHVYADHAMLAGLFPDELQHDIWGKSADTLISAAFDPVGRAKPVDGGFLYSGVHHFSSGVDYVGWLLCGGFIEKDGKLDGPHFFMVPRGDATLIDDWNVMGLSGTGSKTFVIENKFVPVYRFLDGQQSREASGPGVKVNQAPTYRMPRGGTASTGFTSLAVGMARGVLNEWLAITSVRKTRGILIGDRSTAQLLAGEASALIDAGSALYLGGLKEIIAKVARAEPISTLEAMACRRNAAFAVQLALQAAGKLFNHAGGRALFTDGALQRQYRNLLAAGTHHGVMWEEGGGDYGAMLLGRK